MRAPLFAFGRRKKPKFMEKRKLLKRVKKLNIYNRNISGMLDGYGRWTTVQQLANAQKDQSDGQPHLVDEK